MGSVLAVFTFLRRFAIPRQASRQVHASGVSITPCRNQTKACGSPNGLVAPLKHMAPSLTGPVPSLAVSAPSSTSSRKRDWPRESPKEDESDCSSAPTHARASRGPAKLVKKGFPVLIRREAVSASLFKWVGIANAIGWRVEFTWNVRRIQEKPSRLRCRPFLKKLVRSWHQIRVAHSLRLVATIF